MRLEHWLYTIPLRLRSLFRRNQLEQELDEELQIHLEQQIEMEVKRGKTPEEARYRALQAMGGMEQRKEECRDSRRVRWLQDLTQDLAYGVRTLMKTPGFTVVAAVVLALGIGANTAVFTVVKSFLLRPLPYDQAERLFLLSNVPKQLTFDPGPTMADRDYLQFRRYNHSFESLSNVASPRAMTLTRWGEPAVLSAARVGQDFTRVLHVKLALGHDLYDQNSALLSYRLWTKRFGRDRKAVGSNITLDGLSYSIAGIMPETFEFQNADLWVRDDLPPNPHNIFFPLVIGRLKPGISARQAQAELETFAAILPHDSGLNKGGFVSRVLPLKELFVADVRKLLLIFVGAVAFVFLIACANYANLLLIRSASRHSEIALRTALGASRGRLLRQLMTESMLLSLVGAALGLLLSVAGVPALLALLPPDRIPSNDDLRPDQWVMLFTFALSMVTGLVFGLAPALQVTKRELREGVIKRRERLQGTLVTVEVALALVLLVGAGLLTKSFLRMRSVNLGFRAENVAVATVDLPQARYHTASQMQEFDQRVLAQLSMLPGAKSAAAVSYLPFGYGIIGDFQLEDGTHLPEDYDVDKPEISPDYFRAMGIGLVTGRVFTQQDNLAAPGVVIISQSVAKRLWPGGNAIGQHISMEDDPKPGDWLVIVGIVQDVRQQGINDTQRAVIYQPIQQIKSPGFINHMSFVVRSENPAALAADIRTVIQKADPDLAIESLTTMNAIVAHTLGGTRSQTRLLGIFSLVALLLAAIGIYGVLAYSVDERTHEIGIRMALGGEPKDIIWMVLRRTLLLTGSGVLIGVAGALAVTGVLEKFLFEVRPEDPATLSIVAGILFLAALFSAWIPAKRATGIYPLAALRHD